MTSINDLAEQYIKTKSERDLAVLLDRLKVGLINYSNNVLHDENAAKDVVADSFIKIWRKVDTYDPKWAFSTWVYTIVRNETMQYLRKKKRTVSLESRIKYMGASDDAPDLMVRDDGISNGLVEEQSDDIYEDDRDLEIYARVLEHIAALPPQYKDILNDREIHNMKYKEIAAKYGLELNTVKTRIIRARQKICEVMEMGKRKIT